MLNDNKMSSRSLKHWTNGAAFHLQILIHQARLEMQSTTEHEAKLQGHLAPITTVLEFYESQLEELLKQYKTYKKSTISITHPLLWTGLLRVFLKPHNLMLMHFWIVEDKEFERQSCPLFFSQFLTTGSSNDYVDYMFGNWAQLKELKRYFSGLKGKIKDLILQNDEFKMHEVLPVLDEQDDKNFHLYILYTGLYA